MALLEFCVGVACREAQSRSTLALDHLSQFQRLLADELSVAQVGIDTATFPTGSLDPFGFVFI